MTSLQSKIRQVKRSAPVRVGFAIAASLALCLHQEVTPADARSPMPLQLEMRVSCEPTAFPSAGHTYLAYELYVTNFTSAPLTLRRIEVRDADSAAPESIAGFEGSQLDALLQPLGFQPPADASINARQIAAGGSVVIFLWIALDHRAMVPNKLRHRVFTTDSQEEGATIGTHRAELKVLGSPVQGANWLASDGPSNDQDNYHRRGIFVFDGRAQISRRFAIDWMQIENGATFSGDPSDNQSYHAYGKPVLAAADATVITAKDGLPDNVPGHNEEFKPAVPLTMESIPGNTIGLDLGRGQYAYYLHLQQGSLRVKVGDHVRRGEILARIGNSGDAREPHLHFQVSTSSQPLLGEGVPYLIDHYRATLDDNSWEKHTRELPLRNMHLDFGQVAALPAR